ncbi:MAG: transposase domain-containing protein, partial [Oscillibacter sp.]|nr:transposase domain-containing protein [Oscillibacter sp.]
LKPYEYLRHLLTEIPKHTDETDASFLDDLLPWSDAISDICRKPVAQDPPGT